MSDLVSFNCGACQATLSIPVEQAGISGPCPYCGTHVTSPKANRGFRQGSESVPLESRELRPWQEARMAGDETVLPVRPRRAGLYALAGLVLFGIGVMAAWKFWDAAKPREAKEKTAEPPVVAPVIKPRPEVLASATDILPPPADEMPAPLPQAPTAIARNLSTASARKPGSATLAGVAAATNASAVPVSSGVTNPNVASVLPPAGPAVMSDAEKEIRKVVRATGEVERPGNTLIRFFAAKTWQERLRYSLIPEKVKPLMEAYYRTHADGPIVPEEMELTRIEAVEGDPSRKYYAYIVYFPRSNIAVPISVQDTRAGCLVEWSSFVEGKDHVLEEFFKGYRKEPGTYRVVARLGHYFGNDVPDQEKKVVFDLRSPDDAGPFKIWVDRDSPLFARHFATGERARWDVSSRLVLKLQWERTPDGVEYVRLRDVIAETWHPSRLP